MLLLKNIPIEFSKKDILSYLGYKPKKSSKSAAVDVLLEEAIDLARMVMVPAAVLNTYEVEISEREKIVFPGTNFCLKGERIAQFMAPCPRITLVAATIGPDIDIEIERLFASQDSSRAVVLDAVGSDAAEQAVSWIDAYVQGEAKKLGFRTLHRVSPGYPLWSIEANGDIAMALKAGQIGIEVLPSYEMLPRKSVIAAIGWVSEQAGYRRRNQ